MKSVSSSSTQGAWPPFSFYWDLLGSTQGLLGDNRKGRKTSAAPSELPSEYFYSGQSYNASKERGAELA